MFSLPSPALTGSGSCGRRRHQPPSQLGCPELPRTNPTVVGVGERWRRSDGPDGRGLGPLAAFGDLEFDLLPLEQLPISLRLDLGVVDEEVASSVIGRDESIALLGVEPFDDPAGHAPATFHCYYWRGPYTLTRCPSRAGPGRGWDNSDRGIPDAVPLMPPETETREIELEPLDDADDLDQWSEPREPRTWLRAIAGILALILVLLVGLVLL